MEIKCPECGSEEVTIFERGELEYQWTANDWELVNFMPDCESIATMRCHRCGKEVDKGYASDDGWSPLAKEEKQ